MIAPAGPAVLLGQYDSAFVRRVAITMTHYGVPFERRVLSVFGDFADVQKLNPLGKVPALFLPDGMVLLDSAMILDYLDEQAGPEIALTPPHGLARHQILQTATIACVMAEKTMEYRGETVRRPAEKSMPEVAERHLAQILGALDWLEASLGTKTWFWGNKMTQADITAAVCFTNLAGKIERANANTRAPNLRALAERCEALPIFQAVPFDQ